MTADALLEELELEPALAEDDALEAVVGAPLGVPDALFTLLYSCSAADETSAGSRCLNTLSGATSAFWAPPASSADFAFRKMDCKASAP